MYKRTNKISLSLTPFEDLNFPDLKWNPWLFPDLEEILFSLTISWTVAIMTMDPITETNYRFQRASSFFDPKLSWLCWINFNSLFVEYALQGKQIYS